MSLQIPCVAFPRTFSCLTRVETPDLETIDGTTHELALLRRSKSSPPTLRASGKVTMRAGQPADTVETDEMILLAVLVGYGQGFKAD